MGKMLATEVECLFPECDGEVHSRGLCTRHYATAWNVVDRKQTTWEKLIAEGKALEVRAPVQNWFLKSDE